MYGAQGNLALAKDAADKAATAQYEDQQRQIDYQKALLDANAPQLNKEETAQAAIIKAQLDERQAKIDAAKEDKKSIIALATAALANNPNDPAAQYAAQQALAESNKDQPDIQKALELVGKYQQDPNDIALKIGQLQAQRDAHSLAVANVAKINNDIKNSQPPISVTGGNAAYINAFNNATAGLGVQKSEQASKVFAGYINNGDLEGAKAYIVRTALANAGADQQNQAIGRTQALSAMTDVESLLAQAKAKGVDTNILSGNLVNIGTKLGASPNTDLSYIGSRILQALITYRKGMTGVAFGPQEAADYVKIFQTSPILLKKLPIPVCTKLGVAAR